jgi:hypothetical protein
VRMIVRRPGAAITGPNPVAMAVAWVAAARWIVVPFAPIQLAVAAGTATQAVDQSDQPATAFPEAAAALRAATAIALACCRAAAALLVAMVRPRTAANWWTALGTAGPRLARKSAAVDGVAFARWIAAAARFAATCITTTTVAFLRVAATNSQHPKQIRLGRDRRKQRYDKQNCEPTGVSHLSRSLALRAGAHGESGESAERKVLPLLLPVMRCAACSNVAVSRWVSSTGGLPLDEKNRYNLPASARLHWNHVWHALAAQAALACTGRGNHAYAAARQKHAIRRG